MNTSFSKYVKQCKWGLSLDTAGSDYSAHNNLGASARTQRSARGGEPVPGRRAAALRARVPARGDWRASARGGRGPRVLTLYCPPPADSPGRGGGDPGTQRPSYPLALGHPRKLSRLCNNL